MSDEIKRKMYLYNTLTRNNLNVFKQSSALINYRILQDDNEFAKALYDKALEELEELFTAKTYQELVEEFADVEEVLHAFKQLHAIAPEDIKKAQDLKKQARGGYEDRIFLTAIQCAQGSRMHRGALSHKYRELNAQEYDGVITSHEDNHNNEL